MALAWRRPCSLPFYWPWPCPSARGLTTPWFARVAMSLSLKIAPPTAVPFSRVRSTEPLIRILFTKSGSLHGYTSLDGVMNKMIHSPDLYIDSLPYSGDLKVIIHQIARFRLRGHRAQMSWLHLCRSIGKSRRTLAKLMRSEKFKQVVTKIRRGKKQTNLYYLASWLWDRLTVGRKKPSAIERQASPSAPFTRAPSVLMGLFAEAIRKQRQG